MEQQLPLAMLYQVEDVPTAETDSTAAFALVFAAYSRRDENTPAAMKEVASEIAATCGVEVVETSPLWKITTRYDGPVYVEGGPDPRLRAEGKPEGIQVHYKQTEGGRAEREKLGRPLSMQACAVVHGKAKLPSVDSYALDASLRARIEMLAEAQGDFRLKHGRYATAGELNADVLETHGFHVGVTLQQFQTENAIEYAIEYAALWMYNPDSGGYCQGLNCWGVSWTNETEGSSARTRKAPPWEGWLCAIRPHPRSMLLRPGSQPPPNERRRTHDVRCRTLLYCCRPPAEALPDGVAPARRGRG
jgi:hypothetical protein